MKKFLLIIVLLIPMIYSFAQEEKEKKFGIQFTGFVKADIFYDTRQTIAVRQGHFLLYPAPQNLDEEGNDINARGNFHILTIQTRLRANLSGPDVFGAKTSGAIEGEFFGHSNGDINGFRLRHAFVKLTWKKSHLLIGQYWNPMFITKCFPGTVSFNTGAPFLPFSRNPQINFRYSVGHVNFYATAYAQVDFVSAGPIGPSPTYLSNAGIPALNFRVEYDKENADKGTAVLVGASINYKMILPQLSTAQNYKTSQKASSVSATAFFKYKFKPLTFKIQGTYGQDTYDLTMIGGYAVSDSTDKEKGFVDYTPLETFAIWTDIHSNGKKIQVGLLAAYMKNLGTNKAIEGPVYARGSNIEYGYRVAPRLIFNVGKFRIAPEIEWDIVAYGDFTNDGQVVSSKEVSNVRFLVGVYYFFNSKIF